MKKYKIDNYYLISFLLFLTYSIISLLIMPIRNNSFWVYYIFTCFAFLISSLIYYKINNKKKLSERFNNISVLIISYLYIIFQTIFSILFMSIDTENTKIFILIQVIVFILYIILIIALNKSANYISSNSEKKNNDIISKKQLQLKLELYVNNIDDEKDKKKIYEIIEDIKYMDPIASNEEIINIDKLINKSIEDLVNTKNDEDKLLVIKNIKQLIYERNEKAKISKLDI